jgi:predicted short-subunit dehydrogenase-like oxidoreductase (DUF2520 family)
MLPVMATKPGIAIVGAGNLANALATSLHRAGYRIDGIVSRSGASSVRKARLLARKVSSTVLSPSQVKSRIVWLCVPDGEIAHAAQLLRTSGEWSGRVVLHSSGALTSDELAVLRRRGASVASVHPFMTFVRGSQPTLAGVPFAIEGDVEAARMARGIVRRLRGQAFSIRKSEKVAYHAWGMFASPLLTALLAITEQVARAAGVRPKSARQRMLPILAQTIANYAALGAPGTLSGPIVRGDSDTVKKHLQVLGQVPAAREVYIALARASLRYLPAKNRAALEKILKGQTAARRN